MFVLYSQNYAARALPILFNTPKKSLLKSSYPKEYLPNFRTQKNPGIKNFKPQKILRLSPSLEIPSTPPPPGKKPHLPVAHAYADDSQLYVSFKPNNEVNESIAIESMELCIRGIRTWVWMDKLKLKLNDDKTELMIIGSRHQLEKVSVAELSVGDTSVASASTTRLLV